MVFHGGRVGGFGGSGRSRGGLDGFPWWPQIDTVRRSRKLRREAEESKYLKAMSFQIWMEKRKNEYYEYKETNRWKSEKQEASKR